jgi:hypothetical protein
MGAEKFFSALPLKLLEEDMNSLTFAQDSRSYLISIVKEYITNGDLAYFI